MASVIPIILGYTFTGIRIAVTVFYRSSLEGPIKHYFKNRKVLSEIEKRIEELCIAQFDGHCDFSTFIEELGINEDVIMQAVKKTPIRKGRFNSFKLWNSHIDQLISFLKNFIEIYNIELEQFQSKTLSDSARVLWNNIINEIEIVLLNLRPNELVVKNFKTLQKMETQLNTLVDSFSTKGRDVQLENLYNYQIKKIFEKINALANSQNDAIHEIHDLQSQIERYQTSEFMKHISEIKHLLDKGFDYIFTNVVKMSESSDPLLIEIIDHLSSQSQSLSVIISEFRKDIHSIKGSLDDIKKIIAKPTIKRDLSAQQIQSKIFRCEYCNQKFLDDFISKLRENGGYVCPKCGTVFPGLSVFLSGTSRTKFIYEYVSEPLKKCGYEILWYINEFHAFSNNALEDCFQNLELADRVVLTIGPEPGEQYKNTDHTIIEEEFNRALSSDKRILVFIENEVYKKQFEIDSRVLKFIKKVQDKNIWNMNFEESKQIANQIINKWGCFAPSLKKEMVSPQLPPELFFIESYDYNDFCELIKMPGFLERPFKDKEEWEIKKNQLFYFGTEEEIEQKFQNTIEKLKDIKIPISLITGKANNGKSTFLLYFVNECIIQNTYPLIIFLNPFIEAQNLMGDDGILNNLNELMETKYKRFEKDEVLLVIDGLRRRENDRNYLEKCEKIFEWVSERNYALIATLRSDQRTLLKRNFKEMPIDKWFKYNLDNGEIKKKSFSLEEIKKTIIRYLKFTPYNEIQLTFSFDSSEFDECVEIIADKAGNTIGDIAFIIEDIYANSQRFSKEMLKEYPEGLINLRWNTIKRDYYLDNDKVLPTIFLFLTYQNYSVTKHFIYKFMEWGLDKLNRVKIDKQQIINRLDNILNFYCISTTFEDVEEFRLRWDWREAIDESLFMKGSPEKLSSLMLEFREILKTGEFINWFARFMFDLQDKLTNGSLSYLNIETWYIVGDMAKAWGINIPNEKLNFKIKNKLEVLKNASEYLIQTINSHPEVLDLKIPIEFLKKTFSFIWKRTLRHITTKDFPQYLDVAVHFYKRMKKLYPEDYWLSWMLGEIFEKKGEFKDALEYYIESANIQNSSKSYGSLIAKIKSFQLAIKREDEINLEFLTLRQKVALKAIECHAYYHKNWSDLAEALIYKGDIFKEQTRFGSAIKYYDKGIKAYERGIKVPKEFSLRSDHRDIIRSKIRIAVNLRKRAYANKCIGNLEASIEDIQKAIKIKSLSKIDEDLNRDNLLLEKYTRDLVYRKYIINLLDIMFEMAEKATKCENMSASSRSDDWYVIKTLLDQMDPRLIGDNINDLKISALQISLQLNPNNSSAERDLIKLNGKKTIEHKKCTPKYHESKAESIEKKERTDVSEIIYRSFCAVIDTLNYTYYIHRGEVTPDKQWKYRLSLRWSILGKRISEDFFKKISHKIARRSLKLSIYFRPNNHHSWHHLGWEYLYDEKIEEALNAFKQNVKLEENKEKKNYSHLSKIGIGKIYEEKRDIHSAVKWLNEGAELSIKIYGNIEPELTVNLLLKSIESINNLTTITTSKDEENEILKHALDLSKKALNVSKSAKLADFSILLREKKDWLLRRIEWIRKGRLVVSMALDEILEIPLKTLLSMKSESDSIIELSDKEFIFTQLKDFKKAIEYADLILDLQPNNVYAMINKAQSLGNLNRYKEALEEIEQALKIDPNNAFAWHNKGLYLNNLGRFSEAIQCYDKSIQLNSHYAPAWFNKGFALSKMKNYEDAIECYKTALELEPNNEITWSNMGWAHNCLRRYKDSINFYNKALEINPRLVKAWNNKAQALGHIYGCQEEGLTCIDKAIKIAEEYKISESDPQYFSSLHDNRGYILNELQRYEEALECFDKTLELNPDYASAWHNKGYTLHKLGRLSEAIECYKKRLELAPSNRYIWNKTGFILNDLQKYEEALEYFNRALELNPKYVSAWHNKIYAVLHISLEKKVEEGFLNNVAAIIEYALSKIENRTEFIEKLYNLTISWLKNSILKGCIDSNEKLHFFLHEYERTFEIFDVKVPTLEDIKAKVIQSEKFEEKEEEIQKIFN